jgi:hypothetical protein
MDADQALRRQRRLLEIDRQLGDKLDAVAFDEGGASYAGMLLRQRRLIRSELERLAKDTATAK